MVSEYGTDMCSAELTWSFTLTCLSYMDLTFQQQPCVLMEVFPPQHIETAAQEWTDKAVFTSHVY